MSLEKKLEMLALGHACLWVGAGINLSISKASPSWSDVVIGLEKEAELSPPEGLDLPSRLDATLNKLGRIRFQKELRKKILEPLAEDIVAKWRTSRKNIPPEIRALAHLVSMANPVVNFNIETLSSSALMIGPDPWSANVFHPPIPDMQSIWKSPKETHGKKYQRRVYHPHGALDVSGISVMTKTEYKSMNGTLGLQLAGNVPLF